MDLAKVLKNHDKIMDMINSQHSLSQQFMTQSKTDVDEKNE